ncbi:MAG: hypothetical protein AB9891_06020 [Anaerolineaceae bacterium]
MGNQGFITTFRVVEIQSLAAGAGYERLSNSSGQDAFCKRCVERVAVPGVQRRAISTQGGNFDLVK